MKKERERIDELDISSKLTKIKYVNNVSPYYYFQLTANIHLQREFDE